MRYFKVLLLVALVAAFCGFGPVKSVAQINDPDAKADKAQKQASSSSEVKKSQPVEPVIKDVQLGYKEKPVYKAKNSRLKHHRVKQLKAKQHKSVKHHKHVKRHAKKVK